jgi:heme/copper-type cytochrome/quinol oxidase subunit 1
MSVAQHIITGWTMYPPLSSLGVENGMELEKNNLANLVIRSLLSVNFIIVSMLVWFAYRWGKGQKIE